MISHLKTNHEKESTEFPCLMITDLKNLVVLFEQPESGTVVHAGRSNWRVGVTYHNFNMGLFSLFKGEITLSN